MLPPGTGPSLLIGGRGTLATPTVAFLPLPRQDRDMPRFYFTENQNHKPGCTLNKMKNFRRPLARLDRGRRAQVARPSTG